MEGQRDHDMTTRHSSRGRGRFEVRLSGMDSDHKAINTRLSAHNKEETAIKAAIEVIQQWAKSFGATTPGTQVSIVDTTDGGKLFTAQYLGYEDNTIDAMLKKRA